MANGEMRVTDTAVDLPEVWDQAASGNLFLSVRSLLAIERSNPCGQKYHIAETGESCSICVTYRHRLDVLTYGRGSLRVPVTVIGIPCSVSRSGYHFAPGTAEMMIDHILRIRGAKLILNSSSARALAGFALGRTLPSCELGIAWASFEAYLSAMRSHYRYRVSKALARWESVSVTELDDSAEFGDDLYELYLNVFGRSRYKLEKLPIEFFRMFPARITWFEVGGKPIGFVQTAREEGRLVFMFGGLDYGTNADYDTYLNSLLHIIRSGIEAGCSSVDLGQTAEGIKSKLGCRLVAKALHAAHSNHLANQIIRGLMPLLSYDIGEHAYRVFR